MALAVNATKEALAAEFASLAVYGAAYTTTPGGSPGTEPSGGSPAYARKTISWTAGSSDGIYTGTVTLDIPASTTIVGVGCHSAVSGGTFIQGATVTSTQFTGQGQLTVNYTYTQS